MVPLYFAYEGGGVATGQLHASGHWGHLPGPCLSQGRPGDWLASCGSDVPDNVTWFLPIITYVLKSGLNDFNLNLVGATSFFSLIQ